MIKQMMITAYCKEKLNLSNRTLGKEYFYASIPLAIIDAIFSIQLSYESTAETVENYCKAYGLKKFDDCKSGNANHKVSDLIANIEAIGTNSFANDILYSKHRTAGKNNILKAEAVYQWAKILRDNKIETFEDFRKADSAQLERELISVQGQGEAVIKYFFMLCGDDTICKPDRHLLRFLSDAAGKKITPNQAQELLSGAVEELKAEYPEMTVRLLDYIIWDYKKNLSD